MSKFTASWKQAWGIGGFRDQFVLTIPAVIVLLVVHRLFLEFIERRPGLQFADPILNFLPTVNLSWVTYALVYSGLVLGVVSLCFHPYPLLRALRAYALLLLFRIICLYFLPLAPPAGLIPLQDPIVSLGSAVVLTRDLFFSERVAALSLVAFAIPWRDLRIVFSIGAIAVSICFLLQHVHYTIDLLAAPCFAYVSFGIAGWLTVKEPSPAELKISRKPGL